MALESQTIKHMIEEDCADTVFPLPNVTSAILSKVIEYCKKHVEARGGEKKDVDKSSEDELKTWDQDFIKVDQMTLFDLILAARFLNIEGLFDLTCQTVAHRIASKLPKDNGKAFNITNDLTPEEEEEARRERQWECE